MPTYISLVEYTQSGIENIRDSPDRLDEAKSLAQELGGELSDFYLTMGQYDMVVVGEFPDDETYAEFLLYIGSGGNVSTETLKAFPEDQYRELIAEVSELIAEQLGPPGGPPGHTE